MASICGGTLALMDAGVPHQEPGGRRRHGPREGRRPATRSSPTSPARKTTTATWTSRSPAPATGITALQMDIKIGGHHRRRSWPRRSSRRAQGRLHILDRMAEALAAAAHRASAPYAPRILTIRVPVDKIRDIIGPGGKMIRSIVERTGCKIDVEDDGRVSIASVGRVGRAQGRSRSSRSSPPPPSSTRPTWARWCASSSSAPSSRSCPGTDGLLHVSEMAHHRVNDVRDEVKEGDQVLVKVVSIDPSGKIRLSRKALLEEAEGGTPAEGGGGGEGGRRPTRTRPGPRRRPRARPRPRPAARRPGGRGGRGGRGGHGGPRPGPARLTCAGQGSRASRWRPRRRCRGRRGARAVPAVEVKVSTRRLRALAARRCAAARRRELVLLERGRRALLRDRRPAHREADRARPADDARPHAGPRRHLRRSTAASRPAKQAEVERGQLVVTE